MRKQVKFGLNGLWKKVLDITHILTMEKIFTVNEYMSERINHECTFHIISLWEGASVM